MSRPLTGEDVLLSAAQPALVVEGADAVEVGLSRGVSAVTRFAGSRVHQSSERRDGEARVRVVVDGRVGVAATNDLSADGVRAAARSAVEVARLLPRDPAFPGLAPPASYEHAAAPDPETLECPAQRRADLVRAALAELPDAVSGSGTVATDALERAVVSTEGVSAYAVSTSAGATVLASGPTSSGWAEAGGPAVGALDLAALGRRAAGKVRLGAAPRQVPPGRYPVVLEPGASAVLVQWLGWLALAGRAVNEGRSALSGRMGEQVCSPQVTVVDDPLSPLLPGAPFDAEGTPARRTVLVDRGVAVQPAHDRATGAAAGTTSTGHALPPPNPEGGLPQHLVLQPGSASPDGLVAGLERGLYVTRFHYTNVVHAPSTTLTGMTRDGTFLVEDGRIVAGVRDLRFRDAALAALSAVEDVGAELEVSTDLFAGPSAAPALRLSGLTFTS